MRWTPCMKREIVSGCYLYRIYRSKKSPHEATWILGGRSRKWEKSKKFSKKKAKHLAVDLYNIIIAFGSTVFHENYPLIPLYHYEDYYKITPYIWINDRISDVAHRPSHRTRHWAEWPSSPINKRIVSNDIFLRSHSYLNHRESLSPKSSEVKLTNQHKRKVSILLKRSYLCFSTTRKSRSCIQV